MDIENFIRSKNVRIDIVSNDIVSNDIAIKKEKTP